MPLLYSLGTAHCIGFYPGDVEGTVSVCLRSHDDLYVVTVPNHVGAIFAVVQECMRRDANIRFHLGKIKVRIAGGIRPRACGRAPTDR